MSCPTSPSFAQRDGATGHSLCKAPDDPREGTISPREVRERAYISVDRMANLCHAHPGAIKAYEIGQLIIGRARARREWPKVQAHLRRCYTALAAFILVGESFTSET